MKCEEKRTFRLFSYNEDSFLDSGMARGLNYTIMAIIMFVAVSNEKDIEVSFPSIMILIIPAAISIISAASLNLALDRTQFYEWDYTERQKKKRFTLTYILITVFLCSLCSWGFIIAYPIVKEIGLCWTSIVVLFPPFYFLLQLPFVITLYYPMFSDDLTMSYKIQEKPDGWQKNGKEIRPEDEIDEIRRRDWGI